MEIQLELQFVHMVVAQTFLTMNLCLVFHHLEIYATEILIRVTLDFHFMVNLNYPLQRFRYRRELM